MDYEKIIRELIAHFLENEGVDYLDFIDNAPLDGLSAEENAVIVKARDELIAQGRRTDNRRR